MAVIYPAVSSHAVGLKPVAASFPNNVLVQARGAAAVAGASVTSTTKQASAAGSVLVSSAGVTTTTRQTEGYGAAAVVSVADIIGARFSSGVSGAVSASVALSTPSGGKCFRGVRVTAALPRSSKNLSATGVTTVTGVGTVTPQKFAQAVDNQVVVGYGTSINRSRSKRPVSGSRSWSALASLGSSRRCMSWVVSSRSLVAEPARASGCGREQAGRRQTDQGLIDVGSGPRFEMSVTETLTVSGLIEDTLEKLYRTGERPRVITMGTTNLADSSTVLFTVQSGDEDLLSVTDVVEFGDELVLITAKSTANVFTASWLCEHDGRQSCCLLARSSQEPTVGSQTSSSCPRAVLRPCRQPLASEHRFGREEPDDRQVLCGDAGGHDACPGGVVHAPNVGPDRISTTGRSTLVSRQPRSRLARRSAPRP